MRLESKSDQAARVSIKVMVQLRRYRVEIQKFFTIAREVLHWLLLMCLSMNHCVIPLIIVEAGGFNLI
jgi:hypothetical protein